MNGEPRSKAVLWTLIAGTVLSVLALPLALMWAGFSVMASDAGVTPAVSAFIYLSMAIPLAFVLGPVGAWIAYAIRRQRLAVSLLFLPVAPFVGSLVAMAAI